MKKDYLIHIVTQDSNHALCLYSDDESLYKSLYDAVDRTRISGIICGTYVSIEAQLAACKNYMDEKIKQATCPDCRKAYERWDEQRKRPMEAVLL